MALTTPDFARDDVNHFVWRVLQDAWAEATRDYWHRRAAQLEAARPRAGDFHGNATRGDLRDRWESLTAAAAACRRRAGFCDATRAEFDQVLSDIARGAAA